MFDIRKIKKVELSEDCFCEAIDFVEKTMLAYDDEYVKRSQHNRDKVRADFFVGLQGVIHVIYLSQKLGMTVKNIHGESRPNYDIGAFWGKNELLIDGIKYRVKSQSMTQSKIYGVSWTFNLNPRDPILDNPDANVIFVEIDNLYRRYEADIYPPYKIKDLKFTDPMREELLGKKTIVLEENLSCYQGVRTSQSTLDDLF